MNDTNNEDIEKLKTENIFKLLNSKEEMRNWLYVYFDIYFPMGHVYPTSNSSPVEAAWRIYELMKTGQSRDVPQVALHSSRDCFKTLIAAAIETLCMLHFRICVANASSILSQSEKTVEYINSFFRKIKPYLVANGWKKNSDNKRKIEWITETGEVVYVQVLVMSMRGMNSSHLPMLFIDEADLIQDIRALHESKMIPSTYKSYFPLVVVLSTLKFSGGIMEKLLIETKNAGGEILRWNIMDVTERIKPEEAEINSSKVLRYISKQLPMSNISPEEWMNLNKDDKNKYEPFDAYAGIATHPMLPVMKNMLVDRPQVDCNFLYKPLAAVHNNFKVTPPDMAEAQLLCNKPSSSNLVYPRFDSDLNTLTLAQAYEKISGEVNAKITFEELCDNLKKLGARFIGGADWGYTDCTVLAVFALMPGGEIWLIDTHVQNKIELSDIIVIAKKLNNTWNVDKWYVDQAYPAYIATLRREGLSIPEFKKVVEDGIAAVQSRIVDSVGKRRFFILKTPSNESVIDGFNNYKWALDGKGEIIENKPHHDREGVSDIMDAIRYPFQNLFVRNGKVVFTITESNSHIPLNNVNLPKTFDQKLHDSAKVVNAELLERQLQRISGGYQKIPQNSDILDKPKKKKILFM